MKLSLSMFKDIVNETMNGIKTVDECETMRKILLTTDINRFDDTDEAHKFKGESLDKLVKMTNLLNEKDKYNQQITGL